MFIIHAQKKTISLIKKLLKQKGLAPVLDDNKDFVCLREDPVTHIPAELKTAYTVEIIPDDMPFLPAKKSRRKKIIAPNSPIVVTNGLYKGHSGILKSTENGICKIEITVLGRLVKDTVRTADIEVSKLPWA